MLHQLQNGIAQTGAVNVNAGHIVALRHRLDDQCLIGIVRPTELLFPDDAELALAELWRWSHQHQGGIVGIVAVAIRVIGQPDLTLIGPTIAQQLAFKIDVVPSIQLFNLTRSQRGHREDRHAVVNEHAHVQVGPCRRAFAPLQVHQIEQRATAGRRILDRNDLAPDPVFTQPPVLQRLPADVELDAILLGSLLVPRRTGPERIGLIIDRGGRRDIGDAVLLVRRHARRDIFQSRKAVHPHELVKIQRAVIALRRAAVRAQKIQRRLNARQAGLGIVPAIDNQIFARQLDPDRQTDKLDDVGFELAGLLFGGRQEDLVVAGIQRFHQRFAGKIPRGPDLARFQDHPRLVGAGTIPDLLIAELLVNEPLT